MPVSLDIKVVCMKCDFVDVKSSLSQQNTPTNSESRFFFHNKWWHHSYVNFTMSLEGNFATPINFDVAYKAAARARAIFYLCRASKLARNKVVKYCFQRHVLRHMAMCLGAPCEYNDFSFHLFPLSEGIFCNNCWTRDIVLTLIDFVDICITSDGSDLCQGLEWSP